MTREEITHMFHEAGAAAGWKPGLGNALVINYLTHFYALAAAAEREACAKACKAQRQLLGESEAKIGGLAIAMCIDAISTRGQK